MAIVLTDFDKIWASTSPLTPYSFSQSNYEEGWNFVGSTPPSRQMWDGYFKWNDEKQQYIVNNFLPLSGGTMTGTISTSNSNAIANTTDDSYLYVNGSTDSGNGSQLMLSGKSHSQGGAFWLKANDGNVSKQLIGKPDGTLTWNGQTIQTSSDKRLKQDFADVPADVLDAWSRVEWKQFKFKADVEKKGDSCRWHTGLVAQDVEETCGDKILQYGILCKEDEMWMVRYTEALCMEVAFLRNKIAKLEDRFAKLEK